MRGGRGSGAVMGWDGMAGPARRRKRSSRDRGDSRERWLSRGVQGRPRRQGEREREGAGRTGWTGGRVFV